MSLRLSLADALTWARLLSVIPLSVLAVLDLRLAFLITFCLAVTTDLLDGMAARAAGRPTAAGADFDGSVDLVFSAFALWWIWLLVPEIYTGFWPFMLVALASFSLFFWASARYAKRVMTPHLVSGKAAMGVFALLIPITLIFGVVAWYVHLTWVTVTVSRAEMVYGLVRGKDLNGRTAW